MKIEQPKKDHLLEQAERLTRHLEALRIAEYLELLERPWKLMATNFIAGIARGLGFAIGTTIIFAIVLDSLRRVVLINIPIINDYLIEIIKFIDLKK